MTDFVCDGGTTLPFIADLTLWGVNGVTMLGVKGASFSSVFLGLAFGVGVSCQARLTLSLVNDAGLCCMLGQDQSTRWYCQTCKAVRSGGSPTCLYSTIRCETKTLVWHYDNKIGCYNNNNNKYYFILCWGKMIILLQRRVLFSLLLVVIMFFIYYVWIEIMANTYLSIINYDFN